MSLLSSFSVEHTLTFTLFFSRGVLEMQIYRVHDHLTGLKNEIAIRPPAIPDYLGFIPVEARAERCSCRQ